MEMHFIHSFFNLLGYESLHSTPKQVATQSSKTSELVDDETTTRTSSDADANFPSQSTSNLHRQPYLKHFKDAKMQTVDLEDSNGDTDDMSNMSYDTPSVKWTEELTSKLRNSSIMRKFRFCSGGNGDHTDNNCDSHQCNQNNTSGQTGKANESNKINSSVVLTSKGNKCTLTTNNGVDDEEMDIEDGSSVK